MKRILWAASFVLFSSLSMAFEEGRYQLGVMGGNVSLQGDVGRNQSNALGVGGLVGVFVRDSLAFNLSYLRSTHDGLSHSEVAAGVDGYLGSNNGILPFVSGGFVFASNSWTTNGTSYSGDAFGLFAGLGVDFDLNKNLRAGISFKHNFMFDAEKTISNVKVKTVEDNSSVVARLTYAFGESSWW